MEQAESINTCKDYHLCGGCSNLNIDYNVQLQNKVRRVKQLLKKYYITDYNFNGIIPSPNRYSYRNKMEFSFGYFQGEKKLELGLHPKGDPVNVITVGDCYLIDEDFRQILNTVLNYFKTQGVTPYNVKERKGYLRHLIIRKGFNTGELLVNLITTSQSYHDCHELVEKVNSLDLAGDLVGFLHTINDNTSDVVDCDKLYTLLGRDYFFEELMGLRFKIKSFSFFQVNTAAAEKLYKTILDFINKDIRNRNRLIYDLYCGTGTISQIVSAKTDKVLGIEIDKDAVITARKNTELNNIDNCEFISGDAARKIHKLDESPDTVIVNPPRPGLHQNVIDQIKEFAAPELIYSSCNPETLASDLQELTDNLYNIGEIKCIDMFPHTSHIETCTRLTLR